MGSEESVASRGVSRVRRRVSGFNGSVPSGRRISEDVRSLFPANGYKDLLLTAGQKQIDEYICLIRDPHYVLDFVHETPLLEGEEMLRGPLDEYELRLLGAWMELMVQLRVAVMTYEFVIRAALPGRFRAWETVQAPMLAYARARNLRIL
jgi:hypothetical protein